MRTIRYQAGDLAQQHFGVAVRANVETWFREQGISPKGDGRMLIKSTVMLGVYMVPFVLMLAAPLTGCGALAAWVMMGLGLAGVGMSVMHDAAHGAISKHRWVNRLLDVSMYLIGGNVFVWKVRHNIQHHTHTNVPGVDEDIAAGGPLRFNEHAPLRPVHRFQHFHAFLFYGLLTLGRVASDLFVLVRLWKEGVLRQLRADPVRLLAWSALMKSLYLAVFIGLPLLLTPLPWWQVLIGWTLMHLLAGVILGTVLQLSHMVEGAVQPRPDAQNVVHADWAVHEMMTTVDFNTSCRLLEWCIGGLNRQVEHHLFPHICHVHYPGIAPIVERTAKEHGVTYNVIPSFREALASHVRRLRELGRPQCHLN